MLGLWCILCRIHKINFYYSIDRVIRKYQYANGNTSLWSAVCQYELGVKLYIYFFLLQLHANTISTIDAEPKLNFDLLDRYVTAKLIATASSKSESKENEEDKHIYSTNTQTFSIKFIRICLRFLCFTIWLIQSQIHNPTADILNHLHSIDYENQRHNLF